MLEEKRVLADGILEGFPCVGDELASETARNSRRCWSSYEGERVYTIERVGERVYTIERVGERVCEIERVGE